MSPKGEYLWYGRLEEEMLLSSELECRVCGDLAEAEEEVGEVRGEGVERMGRVVG